ncbi:kinase-like domain-containing protein, partial [Mycena pura]
IARGTWSGVPVAVKVLTKQAEASTLHGLAELWTSLRHAHVLQTFGVSPLDADPLYTVTQFQPAGNVLTFLNQNPHVDRAKILFLQVYDVVVGMEYLHARNIVHGSLKPNNILINADGGACISDYGMIQVQT